MTAWLAMTVAAVARRTRPGRSVGPARWKKGSSSFSGCVEHEGALSEVVEDERGEDERDPGRDDGLAAEVAEVGVKRLGPRDGEEDRAEDDEADRAVFDQEGRGPCRAEGPQDGRVVDHGEHAERAEREEPDRRDRAEEQGDGGGAAPLHGEEDRDDDDRDRQHPGLERGRDELDAFDGREDRDRGRDHRVAREERGAGERQQEDRDRPPPDGEARKRVEREHAAFAPVVGAQEHHDVLDRDDQDERPDEEREEPQHLGFGHAAVAARDAHGLAEGVDRAGPDVAVDDADRAEGEREEALRGGGRRLVALVPEVVRDVEFAVVDLVVGADTPWLGTGAHVEICHHCLGKRPGVREQIPLRRPGKMGCEVWTRLRCGTMRRESGTYAFRYRRSMGISAVQNRRRERPGGRSEMAVRRSAPRAGCACGR